MTVVAVSRVPRHGTAYCPQPSEAVLSIPTVHFCEVLIRAVEEGVIKKDSQQSVKVFDGLVRGVLASAELKTLATDFFYS